MKEVGNTFAIEVNGRRRSSISRTTRRCDPGNPWPLISSSTIQRISILGKTTCFPVSHQLQQLEPILFPAPGDRVSSPGHHSQLPGPWRGCHGAEGIRRSMIQRKYGNLADVSLTDQVSFWRKISGCAVAIFVPGARIDILDRGQIQFMAFGACTISRRWIPPCHSCARFRPESTT